MTTRKQMRRVLVRRARRAIREIRAKGDDANDIDEWKTSCAVWAVVAHDMKSGVCHD